MISGHLYFTTGNGEGSSPGNKFGDIFNGTII